MTLDVVGTGRREARARVFNVLKQVGLQNRRYHHPLSLSGGEQQRVAIARALVGEPEILLADEPTGNLDSANGDEVMNLLSQLHSEGTTIVMVTHSPAYSEYAQRVVHLFDGHIVTENFNQKFHV